MEGLPVDLNNPAVKFHLALVRLQVLTPLSLLLNIATLLTCSLITNPSIKKISRLYPTDITPNGHLVSIYIGAIWVGQIGYCVLLVLARKEETKRAMVSAVGLGLVFANVVMALWAIAFVMQWFLLSTILLGIVLMLLLFSNVALLVYHRPVSTRPLDTALIHAPLRFFFVLPFSILFPLSMFITIGLTYKPMLPDPLPDPSTSHANAALGVILGTNLFSLVIIALQRDIIWCIASTWLVISLWVSGAAPKPASVNTAVISFTILHPLTLVVSLIYEHFYSRRRPNRIALRGDERGLSANVPGAANSQSQTARSNAIAQPEYQTGPSEIEDDAWG